jgi:EpsI family protein
MDEYSVTNVGPSGEEIKVNRAVIAQGDIRQLVYFWFVERGRVQTNEYAVKWQIFWDALTMNRTDGALVRVTTFVPNVLHLPEADARLAEFVRVLDPKLAYYLPQRDVPAERTEVEMSQVQELAF